MASPNAPDFERLLARLSAGLESAGLDFMLIGGQAVLLHGEPRLTQDIDITLGVGPDGLDKVLTACETMELVVLRKRDELDWPYMERWAREFSAVPGKAGIFAALAELRGG